MRGSAPPRDRNPHLLITGAPGTGKTTLLVRLARALAAAHPAGFYTEEIRENGVRRGFRLVGLDGRTGVLSHVRFPGPLRVGRYGVDLAGFEEFLRRADLPASRSSLILVDEIGKMECLSPLFIETMKTLFDSGKQIVATVALHGGGFMAEIKKRPDCRLVEVRWENREELLRELTEMLRGGIGAE